MFGNLIIKQLPQSLRSEKQNYRAVEEAIRYLCWKEMRRREA